MPSAAKKITLSADGFPVETGAANAAVGSRETRRASTTKIENARQVFFLDIPISFPIGRTDELVGSYNAIRLPEKQPAAPQVGVRIEDINVPACPHPARLVISSPKDICCSPPSPEGSLLAGPPTGYLFVRVTQYLAFPASFVLFIILFTNKNARREFKLISNLNLTTPQV
jgi:hypothetical protein